MAVFVGRLGGWIDVAGFVVGLLISTVTAPVGISGAVFLLPMQVSLFRVPSPSVTPTNLLFNVVAGPGALMRYRRTGRLGGPLTRQLIAGTLPGVVLGAVIRVFAVPGSHVFHLLVAAFLLPLGIWLCARTLHKSTRQPVQAPPSRGWITTLALAVGVIGGIYGIGGGSILGPILAGRGVPIGKVARAALAATFLTSLAGAVTYGLLSLTANGSARSTACRSRTWRLPGRRWRSRTVVVRCPGRHPGAADFTARSQREGARSAGRSRSGNWPRW